VGPIYLLELASSQARWLALRQTAIASNVANANTPGYGAVDIAPFRATLERTQVALAVTSPGHIAAGDEAATEKIRKADSWDVVHSGNSVSLEQEMLKAGDVNRDYSLNTAVVRSLHRMFTAAAKG
jgi:flagellar basal-body rod protein FlgB